MTWIIHTVIQGKNHYVSELIKLFDGRYVPGYTKQEEEAITFESRAEAETSLRQLRDMHGRVFSIEKTKQKKQQKPFKKYMKELRKSELN